MLSGINNFLGKVFTINKIYARYIDAVSINDVDMQWFYLGEISFYMSYFQVVIMNVDENPELEWDQANSNRARPLVKAMRIEEGPMSPFKTGKLQNFEFKVTDSLPVTLV